MCGRTFLPSVKHSVLNPEILSLMFVHSASSMMKLAGISRWILAIVSFPSSRGFSHKECATVSRWLYGTRLFKGFTFR